MSKRVVVMANDRPGVEVCRFLRDNGDRIVRLYIHGQDKQKLVDEVVTASGCGPSDVFEASMLKDDEHVAGLQELAPDFIITVYWAHLLSEAAIDAAAVSTVNFHPALLPVNRGWFPHVHSLVDGSPAGVTIHAIDKHADTGPVWAQKEVAISPTDTAYTLYNRLQDEIIELFRETWPKIARGEIEPFEQDESKAVYHKPADVGELDYLDIDAVMPVREVIDLLRARSFGVKGFAYVMDGDRKVYLNIRLGESPSF